MLHSAQLKQQGLDNLAPIMTLAQLNALNLNSVTVNNLFRGLRSCLQTNESEIDILMKVNQILYDLMPDLMKLSIDFQNEIYALIPLLIENLGNPKVSCLNLIMKAQRAKVYSQMHWNVREVFKAT
jgi:hypothetical protein